MFSYGGFVQLGVKRVNAWARTDHRRSALGFFTMGSSCSNHLGIPPGNGPNAVGCTDFMMDHTAEGTFFRLYYPCQEMESAGKPDWVPYKEYFNGLADFMKMNRALSERIFNYLFGSFKIPAYLDAPFKSNEKCPVIIFSHGLGAFRTLYSAICAEMASQGFIVASVEHRDQSASATYYFCEKPESERSNASLTKSSGATQQSLVKEWMYYRALQHGESEFPLRNKQVKQRADECILALDKLTEINSGISVQNVLETHFDWSTLTNSMDLCRIAVMGHSFGGATVIEALCKEVKFKEVPVGGKHQPHEEARLGRHTEENDHHQRYSPPEFPRLHLSHRQLDREADETQRRDRPRARHRPVQ
ncbi:platelet-activating factor acetylhydrolase isoform X3 [Neolamprologus brichardi]|uniref:platelet-activating factor acetylhydrolase isoform X3 n=1 Tax=Neolamprologus brichardi TaxID=32507 RepID=UPI001643C034|nr:platelet-activating factor acetylhydrolase isoform X3 [Neolamprologus brichardi]